ncbi:hypothetical protein B0H65DRAFT_189577 [Neurospora tetraspora]|uniref:Uncharacterized protein n=1 Tax=Neurospora tetraspora TaxID=94610 RepID=A0AAE0JEY8_9PEZI|nr:hypothetical protein B0H65DRAFT_189577 [Neurospora tetraspora]
MVKMILKRNCRDKTRWMVDRRRYKKKGEQKHDQKSPTLYTYSPFAQMRRKSKIEWCRYSPSITWCHDTPHLTHHPSEIPSIPQQQ